MYLKTKAEFEFNKLIKEKLINKHCKTNSQQIHFLLHLESKIRYIDIVTLWFFHINTYFSSHAYKGKTIYEFKKI